MGAAAWALLHGCCCMGAAAWALLHGRCSTYIEADAALGVPLARRQPIQHRLELRISFGSLHEVGQFEGGANCLHLLLLSRRPCAFRIAYALTKEPLVPLGRIAARAVIIDHGGFRLCGRKSVRDCSIEKRFELARFAALLLSLHLDFGILYSPSFGDGGCSGLLLSDGRYAIDGGAVWAAHELRLLCGPRGNEQAAALVAANVWRIGGARRAAAAAH